MKNAKWYIICGAVGFALGIGAFYFAIFQPSMRGANDTIAKLRAAATDLENQLTESERIVGLLDERLNETTNQLQFTSSALQRSLRELDSIRASYKSVTSELASIRGLLKEGASGIGDSQKRVSEIKDAVQRSLEIVGDLQGNLRGGGPTTQ